MLAQQLYYGLVATLGSPRERRPALFILCIGVDLAGHEQQLYYGLVAVLGS
jgi:hypothetical protein